MGITFKCNLSLTCLGFAEVDQTGNVNVSRFGKRIAGCGGLIDISQSTHTVVFCGTMTAGGLEVAVQDGKMQIIHEGQKIKFKKSVEQITFSSTYSNHIKQTVLFVTERCVFTLTANGLMLTEVAPGIDVEKNILPYMEFKPLIADPLKVMDPRLFMNVNIGLKEMLQSK